ncbi:MAG TPA: hypothetical protein VM344_02005 [Vitreimonas sp.]|nr:hypothetical protein [Vitreimonas sp.]
MTQPPSPADHGARREELLAQWRDARRRRDGAPLGGDAFRAAAEEIARLEIAIARLDRSVGRV